MLICTISIFYPLAFSSGVVVTKPSGIREELFFSAQHITQLMYLLFAYFVYIASRVYLHNEKIDLKYVTKVFRITMIVVLVMGILQYLLPSDIFDNLLRNNYGTIYGKYRITSVNNEASFLALFITPMIGYFVFNYIKYRELIDLTIVLFTLVTIKFHSSSSFILGCIIIVLAVVFYFRKELVDNIKKCKSVKLKNKILVIILAFSARAEPETIMGVLREYYDVLERVVSADEATLINFSGDGAMVLVNAPVACSDPALRAVNTAIDMQVSVQNFGRLARTGSPAWLRRRTGHGTSSTVGRIGSEGRLHYSAIGSVVNLASRLCSSAQVFPNSIHRVAASAVGSRMPLVELDARTLKGFDQPVPVFAIVV